MPIAITIPRLGWSMEEGVFAGWLKRDGEAVRPGDALFSLEGEKATQDVEAIDGGTLHIPPDAPAAGDTVLVGAVIGHLLGPGETPPVEAPATSVRTSKDEPLAVAPASPTRHEPGRTRSSPLARRVAREHGIDWTRLRGSGTSGRVRRADVLEAVRAAATGRAPTPPEPPARSDPSKSSPLSPTRRTIAARLVEGLRNTAPVTLTTTADASNLVGLRKQFQSAGAGSENVPTYNDILIKLVALALRDHPNLHARWEGEGSTLLTPDEPHIGLAVDTEAGLVVPVVKGAARLGLREIAARTRELVVKARERRLRPEDVQGGTFSVTNLGAFGVEGFTPIINPPESAVLGVGRIERRPVMDGERVIGREMVHLSLTFDHRVVDGAPAARFLQHLVRLVENPALWLIS